MHQKLLALAIPIFNSTAGSEASFSVQSFVRKKRSWLKIAEKPQEHENLKISKNFHHAKKREEKH